MANKLNPIRKYRIAAEISQGELARRTGISRPQISRYEAGQEPKYSTLKIISKALNVPPSKIINEWPAG
jgi:transcriptional regulator with XRE-family HTH domain